MRPIPLLLLFIFQGSVVAGENNPAQAREICESPVAIGDARDIRCTFNASGTKQQFLFKANFSGGHDDTTASMTATLDGIPLNCEEGSKTNLMGEDGEVSMACKFSITEEAGTKHVLNVSLLWRHAVYTDFRFGKLQASEVSERH